MKLVVLCMLLFAPAAFADPVEVTAKVVELPKNGIRCGVIAFRAVVRYEVISVDKGVFPSKELFAVELCPENLRVGDKKRLRLLNPEKGSHDELTTKPGTRWAVAHK